MAFPTGYTVGNSTNATIDSSKVTADQVDFMLTVDLSDPRFTDIWAVVRADGGDIRITKADGTTQLPRQIVSFDKAGERGIIFVKYTGTLSSLADADIIVWFNGVDADLLPSDSNGAENVWTHPNHPLIAVYHGENLLDSTANGYDLTEVGAVGTAIGGILGDAFDFPGVDDNYLENSAFFYFGVDDFPEVSISGWMISDADTAAGQTIVSIQHKDVTAPNNNSTWFNMRWHDQDANDPLIAQASDQAIAGNAAASIPSVISPGSWYHCVSTITSGVTVSAYINGANKTQATNASQNINGSGIRRIDHVFIGQWWQDSGGAGFIQPMDGKVQEVRVYDGVISDDWTETEFNNQSSTPTFFSAVTENSDPPAANSILPQWIPIVKILKQGR